MDIVFVSAGQVQGRKNETNSSDFISENHIVKTTVVAYAMTQRTQLIHKTSKDYRKINSSSLSIQKMSE